MLNVPLTVLHILNVSFWKRVFLHHLLQVCVTEPSRVRNSNHHKLEVTLQNAGCALTKLTQNLGWKQARVHLLEPKGYFWLSGRHIVNIHRAQRTLPGSQVAFSM